MLHVATCVDISFLNRFLFFLFLAQVLFDVFDQEEGVRILRPS